MRNHHFHLQYFGFYDLDGMGRHLEKMAARGWMLEKMTTFGWHYRRMEPKRLRFVQQRPESPPWLFLLEGKLGAKPFLQVEAPLLIEGEGGFSKEVLRIYQKEKNK